MLVIRDASGSPVLTFTPAVVGVLNYLERIALPETAQVTVMLADVSQADVLAPTIGKTVMKAPAGPPIPFVVTYNLNDIDPQRSYVIQARIEDADGALLFTTDTAYPVITHDSPSYVEVTLVQP